MAPKFSLLILVLFFSGNVLAATSSTIAITDGIIKSLVKLAPVECDGVVISEGPDSSNQYWPVRLSYSYNCRRLDINHSFQVIFSNGRNPALAGILVAPFDLGSSISEKEFRNFFQEVASVGSGYFRHGSWIDVIESPAVFGVWNFPGTSFSTFFSHTDQSVQAFLQGSFDGQVVYIFLGMVG